MRGQNLYKCLKCSLSALAQSSCYSLAALPIITNIVGPVSTIFDNTLFEVSPEIRCSRRPIRPTRTWPMSGRCYYGNHAAGSKPILRHFITSIEN